MFAKFHSQLFSLALLSASALSGGHADSSKQLRDLPIAMSVKTGWNLLALPTNSAVNAQDFAAKFPNTAAIFIYKNGGYQSYIFLNPSATTIGKIDPGDGFWLKATTDGTLLFDNVGGYNVLGMSKFSSAPSGWSLLGAGASFSPADAIAANSSAKSIFTYKNSAYQGYLFNQAQSSSFATLISVQQGDGFWLNVGSGNTNTALFEQISPSDWNKTSVRKILNTFTYGGFATEAQVNAWAAMSPSAAITQMLTFDTVNSLISPPDSDSLNAKDGTMAGLSALWSGADGTNLTRAQDRGNFAKLSWNAPPSIWTSAANRRGLNQFRQKIGYWETNYHMAVNMAGGRWPNQIIRYYDDIMNDLAVGRPYESALATAATSAAVADQYGHTRNVYVNGQFRGNEDFAREFHQLFFGILGNYATNGSDPTYHEQVTIKNTAKALTDMPIQSFKNGATTTYPDEVVTFGMAKHYPAPLEIIYSQVSGKDANESMHNAAKVDIKQQESLDNLPVMIISGLADDALDDTKKAAIRQAWAKMDSKDLLSFLRSYAISKTYFSPTRLKYRTTVDRMMLVTNALTLSNAESYNQAYASPWMFGAEDVTLFAPTHDVFGGQTGLEAADTPDIFADTYNTSTKNEWFFEKPEASDASKNLLWRKDYTTVIPKNSSGGYTVKDVAEWLWGRLIGDGLKNFSPLARAHVYSLLANGQDLALNIDDTQPLKVYATSDVVSNRLIASKVSDLSVAPVKIDSQTASERKAATQQIGKAIAFIAATPYIFIEEGQ